MTEDLSYRKRDRLRRKESLESEEQAEKRSKIEQEKVRTGKKKRKNHGNERNYDWNREGCLREVKSYKEGDVINYSKLGKTYGILNQKGYFASNRGQLVKQFLVKNKIDVSKFRPVKISQDTRRPRKAELR